MGLCDEFKLKLRKAREDCGKLMETVVKDLLDGGAPKYKNRVVKIFPKNHIHYLGPVFSPSERSGKSEKAKKQKQKEIFFTRRIQ